MKKFYVGIKGIVRDQARGYILLHRDYKSGDYWDIPGGRMDDDEDFEQTLRRELQEELPGIEVHQVGDLQGAFRLHKDIDADIGLVLLYFLVDATLPEIVKLSDEHQDLTWVNSVTELPDGLNPEIEKILQRLLE